MDQLTDLLVRQHGVVARRQLRALGIDADRVRDQVHARRWRAVTPRVLATVTGGLDLDQRRWAAVLHAGPRSMLGGLSAATSLGLRGWERDEIVVWVDGELSFEPVVGVRFFRTRRPRESLLHPAGAMPRARLEPSVLLWAAYDAPARAAVGVIAACVQQRLTTADRLREHLEDLRPLRRSPLFRAVLADVAAGSNSAAERDVVRICRRYALPEPRRQARRADRDGRVRWTDCEWDLPDGTVVSLEVDGALHAEASSWSADKRRARRLARPGLVQLTSTAVELRTEPHEVALDLRALGVGTTDASTTPCA